MYDECLGRACTLACDAASIRDSDVHSTGNLTAMSPELAFAGPYVAVSGYTFATPECSAGACADQNLTALNANTAATGPPSVCVNAAAWNDYVGGVMTEAACGGMAAADIDHCVQVRARPAPLFSAPLAPERRARARAPPSLSRSDAVDRLPRRARASSSGTTSPRPSRTTSCATRGRPTGARTGTSASRPTPTRAGSRTRRRSRPSREESASARARRERARAARRFKAAAAGERWEGAERGFLSGARKGPAGSAATARRGVGFVFLSVSQKIKILSSK